jgi:hypothetical protein
MQPWATEKVTMVASRLNRRARPQKARTTAARARLAMPKPPR